MRPLHEKYLFRFRKRQDTNCDKEGDGGGKQMSGESAAQDTDTIHPFTVSNDLMNDAPALRERMKAEGYLFFRQLIDREAIRAARQEILSLCAEAGWLKAGTDIADGIAAGGVAWTEPQPEYMAVYNRVQRGEHFHALAHDANLIALLDSLFGEPTLPHPRNIARIIFPQNTEFTTPSHQDYIHIQGTEETYTAWIPLGDCPVSLGSLVVLTGSNHDGILPVHRALGAGGVGIDTDSLSHTWAGSDFKLGDCLLFHSLTVHKALPNLSPDRIRLSVDFRYQPLSHPVTADSLLPHYAQVRWEEIYADWQSSRYQYYWQKLPIREAEKDPRVHAIRSAAGERV
jgi:ectoine hydroxylase-related dioxygenase (phytanoyl-CoA dioxygenase family)